MIDEATLSNVEAKFFKGKTQEKLYIDFLIKNLSFDLPLWKHWIWEFILKPEIKLIF